MRGLMIIAAIAAYLWVFGTPSFLSPYTYRAEVGYYNGGAQAWYVGNDTSFDSCISEAQAMFNSYNTPKPNRAFSWACRKMQGESFLERVR
ncbi:hypothetical protein [Bradyrhizobium sp. RP6]|uniref:hypothetical protein n=1 Tax=Bradyrhizobium sp. RP6 TaxID=2489596 RepID=UPI000F53C294|nr:hypothetical protein [Bradyrhizobium sp. RP6]RQH12461.1 hypothetical protein EHH60_16415 [Bradyrhizobium sp. RP6]